MRREDQTPEARAVFAERLRDRVRRKNAARKAKRQAVRVAAAPVMSKTDPSYRRKLPKAAEMSKSQQRAFLAAAVRNTAQMQAVDQ